MAVTGLAEKVFVQVCIIVRDVEHTAQRYAAILGLPVPEFQVTREYAHTEAIYYGQPTEARAKIACWEIGRLQFELLQPLDEPSAWMDFLKQRGEGIHHVAFFVPNMDSAADSFVAEGYQITQQGLFTGRGGMYTYLDTDRDLGIVIELLEHFGGNPVLNAPPCSPDKGIGTDIVCQVGVIVRNIERTAQRWADVQDVPRPPILTTAGDNAPKPTYNGKEIDATARLAFFDFGQLQLELIEPDGLPSVWQDWLNAHGEGAQHIAFQVSDTQRVIDYLVGHGIAVAQQGLYADRSGVYTYMNSQDVLGTTIELLENFPQNRA